MQFALVKNQRTHPAKGAVGMCPICGQEVIAKCGEVNIHHWSHKKKCIDHWWENETLWHRNWKNRFPGSWQEVIHQGANEKHIADVKTEEGWVVEFQHSYLNPNERHARNRFYKKLIWVVDGTRRKNDAKQFQKMLQEQEDEFVSSSPIIIRYKISFSEQYKLIDEWDNDDSLVLFDFGEHIISYKDGYSSNNDLWLMHPRLNSKRGHMNYFCPISRKTFIDSLNTNRFDVLFQEVSNKIQEHNSIVGTRKKEVWFRGKTWEELY